MTAACGRTSRLSEPYIELINTRSHSRISTCCCAGASSWTWRRSTTKSSAGGVGWCYELNGVMGWALQEIGFEVMRIGAGVMRVQAGDAQLGNHLCLLAYLDQPYLFDVGFGGSLAEPLPLRESE